MCSGSNRRGCIAKPWTSRGDPREKLCAIARAPVYLLAWQLQLALSALGANDGFNTPMVISAAAAILSIVSIVPFRARSAPGFATAIGVVGLRCERRIQHSNCDQRRCRDFEQCHHRFFPKWRRRPAACPPWSEATKPSARPSSIKQIALPANSGRALKVD